MQGLQYKLKSNTKQNIMDNTQFLADLLPKLQKKMPYKWRVQSFSKNKPQATCVAYIDARDVMDRLDECCTFGWERLHSEFKGHLYCGISIVMPDGNKLTRWDCGVESNTDAEKGEASDSFKRAAVNWGIGRFLYDMGMQYVQANEAKSGNNYPYCVDASGKKIFDLTKHINEVVLKQSKQEKTQPQQQAKVALTQVHFDKMKAAIEKGDGDAVEKALPLYDISIEFKDELTKLLKQHKK